MTVITSIRSDNYAEIEALKNDIKSFEKKISSYYLKSECPFIRHCAIKSKSILGFASRLIRQLTGRRFSNEVVIGYLREVALHLNRVYVRCVEYSSYIAEKAQKLYQRVVVLLPDDENLQLELFGQGDYSRKEPESLILPCIQQWFSQLRSCTLLRPFKGYNLFVSSKIETPKQQGEQLELDLTAHC